MIFGGAKRDGTARWRTLSHRGVAFFGLPIGDRSITIRSSGGAPVTLAPGAAQTFLVQYVAKGGTSTEFMGRTEYAQNFWNDWTASYLPARAKDALRTFSGCDISEARMVVLRDPEGHAEAAARHGVAVIDGSTEVAIFPWAVDRPGVFVGKTKFAHLTGRIRRVIGPADVTLNIGPDQRVPQPRGRWGAVVHNPTSDWIASWRDPVTGILKYARFAQSTALEQAATQKRFDLARRFNNEVMPALRRRVLKVLETAGAGSVDQQCNACLWLIVELGIRIGSGGHLGRSARGGSYGATTLLASTHVRLARDGSLSLDFPGKDGVQYTRVVPPEGVPPQVLGALRALLSRSAPGAPVFPDITNTSDINDLLPKIGGYSAKVIRTARASAIFEQALLSPPATSVESKKAAAAALRFANIRVALFCNHRNSKIPPRSKLVERDITKIERLAESIGRLDTERLKRDVVDQSSLILSTSRGSYIDPRIEYAFLASLPESKRPPLSAAAKRAARWAEMTDASYRFVQKKRAHL